MTEKEQETLETEIAKIKGYAEHARNPIRDFWGKR